MLKIILNKINNAVYSNKFYSLCLNGYNVNTIGIILNVILYIE